MITAAVGSSVFLFKIGSWVVFFFSHAAPKYVCIARLFFKSQVWEKRSRFHGDNVPLQGRALNEVSKQRMCAENFLELNFSKYSINPCSPTVIHLVFFYEYIVSIHPIITCWLMAETVHSSAYLSQSQTASHVQEPQSQIQTHTGHAGYSEGPHLQSQHTIINSLVLHKKTKRPDIIFDRTKDGSWDKFWSTANQYRPCS